LIVFGGAVAQGIDNTWHSHAGIVETVIDLPPPDDATVLPHPPPPPAA